MLFSALFLNLFALTIVTCMGAYFTVDLLRKDDRPIEIADFNSAYDLSKE